MVIEDGKLRRLEENDVSEDGRLVIPEGVRSMAEFSIGMHKEILSLQLPQSLEYIPPKEFDYLVNITKLYIPDGIKSLDIKPHIQIVGPKKVGAFTMAYLGSNLHPWEYLRLPKGFTYRDSLTEKDVSLDSPLLVVNLENLDRIIAENKYKGEEVILNIKNVSELPVEKLQKYRQLVNIKKIQIIDVKHQGRCHETNVPYDADTYIKCKTKIDELLGDIDFQKYDGIPNREKYIFGEIVRRLSNITYDKASLRKGANTDKYVSVRNLVGGLLDGSCVCLGYSEILRNTLACCGIESKLIAGGGHVWVQAKLDGQWYNVDLTFDQPKILKGKKPQCLLKSDKDFKWHSRMIKDHISRKKEMQNAIMFQGYKEDEMEECTETVPDDELMQYIYGEERGLTKKRITLKSIKEQLFGRHIDEKGE